MGAIGVVFRKGGRIYSHAIVGYDFEWCPPLRVILKLIRNLSNPKYLTALQEELETAFSQTPEAWQDAFMKGNQEEYTPDFPYITSCIVLSDLSVAQSVHQSMALCTEWPEDYRLIVLIDEKYQIGYCRFDGSDRLCNSIEKVGNDDGLTEDEQFELKKFAIWADAEFFDINEVNNLKLKAGNNQQDSGRNGTYSPSRTLRQEQPQRIKRVKLDSDEKQVYETGFESTIPSTSPRGQIFIRRQGHPDFNVPLFAESYEHLINITRRVTHRLSRTHDWETGGNLIIDVISLYDETHSQSGIKPLPPLLFRYGARLQHCHQQTPPPIFRMSSEVQTLLITVSCDETAGSKCDRVQYAFITPQANSEMPKYLGWCPPERVNVSDITETLENLRQTGRITDEAKNRLSEQWINEFKSPSLVEYTGKGIIEAVHAMSTYAARSQSRSQLSTAISTWDLENINLKDVQKQLDDEFQHKFNSMREPFKERYTRSILNVIRILQNFYRARKHHRWWLRSWSTENLYILMVVMVDVIGQHHYKTSQITKESTVCCLKL